MFEEIVYWTLQIDTKQFTGFKINLTKASSLRVLNTFHAFHLQSIFTTFSLTPNTKSF